MNQHEEEPLSHDDGLSAEEIAAQSVEPLPDKEVASILDLNADLDLGLDLAAPIDLAIAANANVAAPIEASASANLLSAGSTAQSLADQSATINQVINADATAIAEQDSGINQSNDVIDDGGGTAAATDTTTGAVGGAVDPVTGAVGETVDSTTGAVGGAVDPVTGAVGDALESDGLTSALDGNLLNVNVDLAADLDLAAPVAGAVAANANVAAPIDAAVAANIGSIDSQAAALAQQDVTINQEINGAAEATADQQSNIEQ